VLSGQKQIEALTRLLAKDEANKSSKGKPIIINK